MFLSSRRDNNDDARLVTTYSAHRMRLPLLFAVPTDDTLDRVAVFSTTLLREGPDRWGDSPSVYLVAPYRIYHGHDDSQWPDRAFVRERERPAADAAHLPNHDVLLVADYLSGDTNPTGSETPTQPHSVTRHVVYRGPWRHGQATVFSMYCATAIPVLRFNGPGYHRPWPMSAFNRLPLTPASIATVRAWSSRWDPEVWRLDIDAEEAAAGGGTHHNHHTPVSVDSEDDVDDIAPALFSLMVAASAPMAPAPAPAAPAPSPAVTLPSFVASALIADARNRNLACPITMEPINPDTATVTPCYHVFDADALSAWVAQQINREGAPTCPVCKVRI